MLVSILLIAATPVYSAAVVQTFKCQQDEEATRADVLAVAAEWLKAAKEMKGGEDLGVHINFPRAAQMGATDFIIFLTAPSFEAWGTFMDGYEGSAASKVDKAMDDRFDCPDSALWETVKVE